MYVYPYKDLKEKGQQDIQNKNNIKKHTYDSNNNNNNNKIL